jgi:hypothetical protein
MMLKRDSECAEIAQRDIKDPQLRMCKGYIAEELRCENPSYFSRLPRDITLGYILPMVESEAGPRKLHDICRLRRRCMFCFVIPVSEERWAGWCSRSPDAWSLLAACKSCAHIDPPRLCLWCKTPDPE